MEGGPIRVGGGEVGAVHLGLSVVVAVQCFILAVSKWIILIYHD